MWQNLIHQGGVSAHLGLKLGTKIVSPDYYTAYVPLEGLNTEEDIKMNQAVELSTDMVFKTPKGRALVSLNPVLKEYFRDINGDTILEPGETYSVQGRARKNITVDELFKVFKEDGWLYRVSILV